MQITKRIPAMIKIPVIAFSRFMSVIISSIFIYCNVAFYEMMFDVIDSSCCLKKLGLPLI